MTLQRSQKVTMNVCAFKSVCVTASLSI